MIICRIVHLEDDKAHREDLAERLRQDYGHEVISFRDVEAFEEFATQAPAEDDPAKRRPMVVVVDIMLARRLEEGAPQAPRWPHPGFPPPGKRDHYVDDELGLVVANRLREGAYAAIPKDTPVIFFTARENPNVIQEIERLGARWILKPAWSKDVQVVIEAVLASQQQKTKRL